MDLNFKKKILKGPHYNAESRLRQNFKKKILPNGMTILFEKRNLPVISIVFAVRNGGVNESVSEKGISHFIEHMLYKGTKNRTAKEITSEIEKNGGVLNGFTDDNMTAYWCKMPSKHLGLALDVLGDVVKNPLFDEVEFEKERKVIFEEIKMCKDNPARHSFDEIQKLLYEGTMGSSLIGTYKTMNSISKQDLVKKFKETYTPNNLILCVVGNAKFDEIVKFAEDNFGNQKGIVPKQKIILKNAEKTEKRKGIDQASLVFAYHVPNSKDEKNYAAQVLITLMAEGMSSRLFQEIREKKNLAYAIKGGAEITKDYGHSFIYVGTMKENVEKVKKLIIEEFGKVAKDFGEEELNEIKTQMIGNYQIGMEDSQEQMSHLIYKEVDGDAKEFYEYEEKISKVELEDVKELAKKASEKFSFFALVPSEKD